MTVAVLALLAALVAWVAWETTSLAVEKVDVPIPGLPAEFDGFTIVQVTDLHGRRLDPAGALIAAAKAARPDIIAATGDFVDGDVSELDGIVPLLNALAAIAPTYAVSGNHDYLAGWDAVAKALRGCGVAVLENEHVSLVRGRSEVTLAGVSDPVTRRHDLRAAIPEEPAGPIVLLAHGPELHRRLREGRDDGQLGLLSHVSLTLVGHTHGGQIKIPFIGAVTNASGRAFPRTYVEGLTWEGAGWLYISRGIGYTIFPLRFLSRAELTVLTLRSPQ